MAEPSDQPDFERSIAVKPLEGHSNVFVSIYQPWGYPYMSRIAGSIPLAEAAAAAYQTVPTGMEVNCVQAQFLRPGIIGIPLRYEVLQLMTSSNFASRNVIVRQGDDVEAKAVLILSFFKSSLTTKGWLRQHEFIRPPSDETINAAARIVDDPEMRGDYGFNVPEGTPNPLFSAERLEISQEPDINSRTYRSKLRVLSPLSGPTAQILAVIFLSDMFVMDGLCHIKDIDIGVPKVADRSGEAVSNQMQALVSLNHSLRFVRLEGFDVHEGILFEVQTWWAKGRRGVASVMIRDCKGELIATAEQEVCFALLSCD